MERIVITVELDKIFAGKVVEHKKYGKGLIENIDESYLVVNFKDADKISTFVYPDAFEKFIVFEDKDIQAVANKHLRVHKLVVAQQNKRKQEELKRLDDEIKLHHKEEMLKKQKAALAKVAREKRLKDKRKVIA